MMDSLSEHISSVRNGGNMNRKTNQPGNYITQDKWSPTKQWMVYNWYNLCTRM